MRKMTGVDFSLPNLELKNIKADSIKKYKFNDPFLGLSIRMAIYDNSP